MNERVTYIGDRHSPLFRVYQLGQFRLERRSRREWQTVANLSWQHRNVRMLLAYLLHSPGRRRGREQIIEELWPEQDYEEFDVQKLSILLPELQQELPAGAVAHFLRSSQEQLLLWEATSRFLASISQKQPLLLVLDDLHSADDSSLELLSYLIRYLNTQSNQHVLLVGTCRETELAQAHRLRSFISSMQREQAITTLRIQPLTQAQIGTLVAPLPDPIVQHIQTQAAGNPFFAEELARYSFSALSTSSTIKGRKEITGPEAFLLPETITAALDRRMSHLSSACQRLLGKAAVLGGAFELSLLRYMESSHSSNFDEDAVMTGTSKNRFV